jgi:hypothetical protein
MKKKSVLLSFLFLFGVFCAASPAGGEAISSTGADQTGVEITVYNNDLALVKDVRGIRLDEGEGELRFMDVAARIRPETVHVKSLNAPRSLAVLEQNYEFDLISPEKLLEKFVGRKIKIEVWNDFAEKKETVEATLLSTNSGLVFEIDGAIYLNYPGLKIVPSIPDNLFPRPTLAWLYSNTAKEKHEIEVSYLTRGIAWRADYIFVLDEADRFADLTGWVTLDNRSGAEYRNARLKLIAGEVRTVEEPPRPMFRGADLAMPSAAPAPFQEEAFFEYHIYSLDRRTTIGNNQTKQISLLEAFGSEIQKEFIVKGSRGYFTSRHQGRAIKQKVDVVISFRNSEENNLGMPLPKGIIRLYKKDSAGSLQFIGEDRIDHTPRNEEVRMTVGEAFDLVAERRQTEYKRLADNLHETSWELVVRNRKKDESVVVSFLEPVWGDWKVVDSSHPYKQTDAFTLRFDVPAGPDEETTVRFRVRIRS